MKFSLLALLAMTACVPFCSAQEGCAAAKDLIVRALEIVSAQPSTNDLENGLQLLKHAEQMCDESGDAWYYRSLFERKLGHTPQAEYALRNARSRNSEALQQSDDPFHLAAPARSLARNNPTAPQAEAPETRNPAINDEKPEVAHKWALVVGIANFQDSKLKLRYSGKDAEGFAALLRDPKYGRFLPDHVHVLEDEQATTTRVKAEVNWLARMAGEEDLAVIYIATHGSAREQDRAGASYVVTFDTDVSSEDGLYSTALPMVEISNAVRTRVRARKVAVFLDTCHSAGAISQTVTVPASASPQMLDRIREGVGRVILAASQEEESSYEDPQYGHGLFTFYLLQALKQEDGKISLRRVYEYVSAHVDQDAARRGWKQHPVLSRSEEQSTLILGIPSLSASIRLAPEHSLLWGLLTRGSNSQ